jgi:glycosyltransferase involved in cell wall biosynthesis
MSVYNEEDTLRETIDSVLNQADVNFEFIIVNDGSTDGSGTLLDEIAQRDSQVKILHQKNQGITKALINGCQEARGEFIARQDAGDVSLPGRLKAQLTLLLSMSEAVLCSTSTRYLSDQGETVMEASINTHQANTGLRPSNIENLTGPTHHGCVMFRKTAYFESGGYREEFQVAQDLDLWTRMIELGSHVVLQDTLYQAVLRPNAISSTQRERQESARGLIFQCIQHRAASGSDTSVVADVKTQLSKLPMTTQRSPIAYDYFIGSLLAQASSNKCRVYLRRVVVKRPWHLKAWYKLVRSYL